MSYAYIFLSEAQHEYEVALFWYLEKSIKAGENFVTAIDNALKLICEHPRRWRNEHADYFELNVKNYPFSVIYRIDNNSRVVLISSVYHHNRDPQNKYDK